MVEETARKTETRGPNKAYRVVRNTILGLKTLDNELFSAKSRSWEYMVDFR